MPRPGSNPDMSWATKDVKMFIRNRRLSHPKALHYPKGRNYRNYSTMIRPMEDSNSMWFNSRVNGNLMNVFNPAYRIPNSYFTSKVRD